MHVPRTNQKSPSARSRWCTSSDNGFQVLRFQVSQFTIYAATPVVAVNPELDDLPPLALAGLQDFFRSRNMLSWGILTRGKIDLEFDDR